VAGEVLRKEQYSLTPRHVIGLGVLGAIHAGKIGSALQERLLPVLEEQVLVREPWIIFMLSAARFL
jgi:hypothetical protein